MAIGTFAFDSVKLVWIDLANQTQMLCCFKDANENECLQFVKIPKSRGEVTEDVWDAAMTDVVDRLNNPPDIDAEEVF